MSKTFTLTTQAAVRAAFWLDHRAYRMRYYRLGDPENRYPTQNDYPTDVRCAWVDYVDRLQRIGAKLIEGGDPRGFPFLIDCPSHRAYDFGGRGLGVPGRGLPARCFQ